MTKRTPRSPKGQLGVAAVEFALIASIFFTLLFGIIELGRVLFLMNAATEATRLGARVAVVCDVGSPAVRNRMRGLLGVLDNEDIDVRYFPEGCTRSSCESVTVSIEHQVRTYIPFVPMTIDLPSFSTSLPRESLNSYGAVNPVCN